MNNSFICKNCQKEVSNIDVLGTKNRNHCSFCLWSLHVDNKLGDRDNPCQSLMEPIGLTFKEEGIDKYGNKKQGEIMLVHYCLKCGKISINRVSGDDESSKILDIINTKIELPKEVKVNKNLTLLTQKDLEEINRQLFGKGSPDFSASWRIRSE